MRLSFRDGDASVTDSGGRAKTVLVVDYFFPPLAGAGPQRTLGLVRYLARFGWQPIVLTVQSGDSNFYDTSLCEWIPESVDVQRTASFEPLKLARRLFARASGESDRSCTELHLGANPLGQSIRRLRRLEYWLFFPDRHVGWVPFAVTQALRINRSRPIDLIYSSSQAITSHVIGYILSKVLGKAWVADFQDAWAEHPTFAKRLLPSRLHVSMARRLEQLILRSSDHVIVTADPLRRVFEGRLGIQPAKVTVVPCGYDPMVFDNAHGVRRPRFTITHFGSFYAARSPVPFLDALGQCVQEHPDLSRDLEVLFLGTFDPAIRDITLSTIDRWSLRDIVHLQGPVSYKAGVSLLVSSEVLLLIGDAGQWHRSAIPAKLYEYLAARKPVLALLPDGPAAEVLRAARAGMIVPADDVGAIREAIWGLYRRHKDGQLGFPADQDVAKRYAWPTLAARLASVFDDVLSARAVRRGWEDSNLASPPA